MTLPDRGRAALRLFELNPLIILRMTIFAYRLFMQLPFIEKSCFIMT